MNINGKAQLQNNFDTIVIGSGAAGGWAAKELCREIKCPDLISLLLSLKA